MKKRIIPSHHRYGIIICALTKILVRSMCALVSLRCSPGNPVYIPPMTVYAKMGKEKEMRKGTNTCKPSTWISSQCMKNDKPVRQPAVKMP